MQASGSVPQAPEHPDPQVLAAKARRLLEQCRYGAARLLIRAMRPAGAEPLLLAELEARFLLAQGQASAAFAVLDAAVEQEAPSAAGHLVRAELRLVAGDGVGAALDAADALILTPSDTNAKALLGHILLRLGRPSDAAACLQEALLACPREEPIRLDLATALDASGDVMGSGSVLAAGLALNPGSSVLRTAVLLYLVRAQDLEAAITMAMSARREFELDASEYALLGEALVGVSRYAEAADAYGAAVKLSPEDPYLRHRHVAALEFCNAASISVQPNMRLLRLGQVTPVQGLTEPECAA